MTMEQQKRLAYDLMMEYIKQNHSLHEVPLGNIPDIVEHCGDIFQMFYNSLTGNTKFNKLP